MSLIFSITQDVQVQLILCVLGRSLSALASSQILMNPESEEAYTIRGWFDNEGSSMDFSEYSRGDGGSSGGGEIHFPVKLALVYPLKGILNLVDIWEFLHIITFNLNSPFCTRRRPLLSYFK